MAAVQEHLMDIVRCALLTIRSQQQVDHMLSVLPQQQRRGVGIRPSLHWVARQLSRV